MKSEIIILCPKCKEPVVFFEDESFKLCPKCKEVVHYFTSEIGAE